MLHFLYATSRLVFNELLVVFYINTAMSDIRAVHFPDFVTQKIRIL